MYPPVVSVAGFAKVGRGMFRAVSNLTKEMECCNKQVRLFVLRNSVKIILQFCVGGLVSVRLDILVYYTGTFTHISVRVFLLMDGQKLVVLEPAGVLLHRVPTYETKQYIYVHAIFCTELPFTMKIITTIYMLSFSSKRTIFLTVPIKKHYDRSAKFHSFLLQDSAGLLQGGSNMTGTDVCKQAALRSSCATLRE